MDIKSFLLERGACQVGFSYQKQTPFDGLFYAVSIVVKLSDAVVDQICHEPTQTYFHHYRTVNAFLDHLMLELTINLEKEGYLAAAVPASQSTGDIKRKYFGIFPHKTAAVAAGLGSIGKNALFLSEKFGPRVRLGTVFTNMALPVYEGPAKTVCTGCGACVAACPSGALTGKMWEEGSAREDFFSPETCSQHMKKAYQHIGRGAVCGICMRVCPVGQNRLKPGFNLV